MAIHNKYTVEERKIATKIYDLQSMKGHYYSKWHECDAKISSLKALLKGKYKTKK